jgi:hypothetical protein
VGKKKIDIAPYIIKQSSQDGKFKSDDSGFGADLYSKYGNFGISKNKNKQSFDGGNELETTSKNLTYGKNFKIGDSSSLTLEGNYGQSKNKFRKSDTKGGKLTFKKSFSKGSSIKINEVANALKKASKLHAGQAKTLESIKLTRGGGIAIKGTKFTGVK